MGNDRSLEDFLGGGDADEGDADADESTGDIETGESDDVASEPSDSETEPPSDAAAVAPATPTYRWSPDGAACDECGDTVEKRWRDGGRFVCIECKEW